jgi:formamidopyrimidine-DNA glycosylase
MPELPEVETIVRQLNARLRGKVSKEVSFNWAPLLKYPSLREFKKRILNKKIKKVKRRGKFILFYLSDLSVLVVHLKMTGHFIFKSRGTKIKEKYIHFRLKFKDGAELALADLRKFARLFLFKKPEFDQWLFRLKLGPEPLASDFTFKRFNQLLSSRKGRIKPLLLNQRFLAGIGNIYADEILFQAKIQPLSRVSALDLTRKKALFKAIKEILKKAIRYQGTSVANYRNIKGEKGKFQNVLKVYHRHNLPCLRCSGIVKRIKMNNRSAHFCPLCQKLYV